MAILVVLILVGETRADSPSVALDDAKKLFPNAPKSCADIACLIDHAYADDAAALQHARRLFDTLGNVAGVGPEIAVSAVAGFVPS